MPLSGSKTLWYSAVRLLYLVRCGTLRYGFCTWYAVVLCIRLLHLVRCGTLRYGFSTWCGTLRYGFCTWCGTLRYGFCIWYAVVLCGTAFVLGVVLCGTAFALGTLWYSAVPLLHLVWYSAVRLLHLVRCGTPCPGKNSARISFGQISQWHSPTLGCVTKRFGQSLFERYSCPPLILSSVTDPGGGAPPPQWLARSLGSVTNPQAPAEQPLARVYWRMQNHTCTLVTLGVSDASQRWGQPLGGGYSTPRLSDSFLFWSRYLAKTY